MSGRPCLMDSVYTDICVTLVYTPGSSETSPSKEATSQAMIQESINCTDTARCEPGHFISSVKRTSRSFGQLCKPFGPALYQGCLVKGKSSRPPQSSITLALARGCAESVQMPIATHLVKLKLFFGEAGGPREE